MFYSRYRHQEVGDEEGNRGNCSADSWLATARAGRLQTQHSALISRLPLTSMPITYSHTVFSPINICRVKIFLQWKTPALAKMKIALFTLEDT